VIARRAMTQLARLLRDARGTMVIETAIVAPVLVVLSIGGFEVSAMVARQNELQSAAAEAVAIVMASSPTTQTEIDQIEAVVEASSGVPEDDVDFVTKYRCGTTAALTTTAPAPSACDPDTVSTFIVITMVDSYEPSWTHFGFGEALSYNIERSVQIS
jgi:Flp pilus assembly protein TadG